MRKFLLVVFFVLAAVFVQAEDWPTYRHDNRRSGHTPEKLAVTDLGVAWHRTATCPPQPAWPGPAKWDAYHAIRDLPSMRNYDPVFYTVAVGDKVYYSSSADDAVHCLDASSGRELWGYICGGPVRIAPAWKNGRLYFGADDGFVYCLDASRGSLIWKRRLMERRDSVFNNGRLISQWPCRTGVLVEGNTAYCTASLLPWKDSLLCALDAVSGKPEGAGRYIRKLSGSTLEAPLLATDSRLIVMQGRSAPLLFDRATGKAQGKAGKQGGCIALVTDDNRLMYGPGSKHQQMFVSKSTGSGDKLASYSGARAMVVDAGVSYVARGSEMLAIERSTGKRKWTLKGSCPYGLVMAGNTLFAGGKDVVIAIDAQSSRKIWQATVPGRAHGLTVANGALYVSTDTGDIVCFRPGATGKISLAGAAESAGPVKPVAAVRPAPPIAPVSEPGLVRCWVFQSNAVAKDELRDWAGGLNVPLKENVKFRMAGKLQAMAFGNGGLLVTDKLAETGLPRSNITVEAWVRLDSLRKWGGIVGTLQDNGNYERGWVLGYNNRSFCFGLAGSKCARMTYLIAKDAVTPGQWYHVAGTFDENYLRIFVDGQESASTAAQKGSIKYPPNAFFEIGAYHDKDENYSMDGMLQEVRIYDRALDAAEIRQHWQAKHKLFPAAALKQTENDMFSVTPWLQFTAADRAQVYWRTSQPRQGAVVLTGPDGSERRFAEQKASGWHSVTIDGLRANEKYTYRIEYSNAGRQLVSKAYECDTTFNYSVPCKQKSMQSSINKVVDDLLKAAAIRKGIAVIAGDGYRPLAMALAIRSDFRVIIVERDEKIAARVRRTLQRCGVYGSRLSVLTVDSYDSLPIPMHTVDMVLNLGGLPALEVRRLLAPGGLGVMRVNDRSRDIHGAEFVGSGVWTHMYGLADNATYGGEHLAGSRRTDQMDVAWMGRPGPRYQVDRQGRGPGPLAANGRLFGQGMDRILALNAYNGTILWALEIPGLARYNVPHDCSNWCCDESGVYTAVHDSVRRISAGNGRVTRLYRLPEDTGLGYDWGYIAVDNQLLFGSLVKQGAAYRGYWGGKYWYDAERGPLTENVCSDGMFARGVKDGKLFWQYRKGKILNSTISIYDGRIYFAECRNAKVLASGKGRIGMPELWQDLFLVALDKSTGKVVWQKPIQIKPAVAVCYMACGSESIVLVSSASGMYSIYVYDTKDGSDKWQQQLGWGRGKKHNHGSHLSRPIIVKNKLYLAPGVFEMATGQRSKLKMPTANCGSYSATADTVVFRVKPVTRMWNTADGKLSGWTRLRPNCWISTIPGNGMLLSLEGGGGCSCSGWIESSFGFMPQDVKAEGAQVK